MTTALESAVIAAHKAARSIHGVSITYTRGASSVTISRAVPGRSVHDVTQDGSVIEQIKSRDYILLASELKIGGVVITPQRGDQITEGAKIYKVLSVGGEAAWRYQDQTMQTLRIHTKET
jgi:hypothetical protein